MRAFRIGLFLCILGGLSIPGLAQRGFITTYVGPGLPVNGLPAITQDLGRIYAFALDGAGGFYVASESQNRIYRVLADGTIHDVAGSGTVGFSGDGGPAVSAKLLGPCGIALDSAGNLYVADTFNLTIRKIAPDGIIRTVAGNGTAGFSGDGGPALSAQLNYPYDLEVDSVGNLYIADVNNNRIRKVTTGGIISTVAGNGTAGFNGDGGPAESSQLNYPRGITIDAAGHLYIADSVNHRIRRIAPDGTIETVAGNGTSGYSGDNGPANAAQLHSPYDVAFDASGNLYIADVLNYRIRRVAPDGVISTLAGIGTGGPGGDGGLALQAQLSPHAVEVDAAGNLYLANSDRIRIVMPGGLIYTVAGNGGYGFDGYPGPTDSTHLRFPEGVATDPAGNLYIADSHNHRVCKVTPSGVITTIAGNGKLGFSGDDGGSTSQLSLPRDLAVDTAGNVYIAEMWNYRVRMLTPAGKISTVAGTGTRGFAGDGGYAVAANLDFSNSAGVAVDSLGNLYIADTNNHRIRKVTPAGMISTVVGTGTAGYSGDGGPAAEAQIYLPHDVEIDASGNLYIADTWNSRIRKITPSGVITTVAGTGTSGFTGDGGPATSARLSYPKGITLDPAGNLYIADYTNHRIRKVTLAGIISTVAGMGRRGFSGDGGPATAAQLDHPCAVAVDAAGNLYIADNLNHRIRRVTGVAAPSTYFPQVAVGGGYTTVFTFGNNGSETLSGTLALMDQQGNPFVATGTVDNPGIPTVRLTSSLFTISIPPGGVGFVKAESAGVQDPVSAGWAQVDYAGGSLYSVATLQQSSSGVMLNAIGVLPSQPLPYATIPVDYSVSEARRVGYALANPGGTTISITLSLVDQSGIVTNDGLDITLGPGHQIARYLDQDLGRTHFKGSVVLQAKDGATFVGLALMENQGRLSVIPVVPLQAPNIPD